MSMKIKRRCIVHTSETYDFLFAHAPSYTCTLCGRCMCTYVHHPPGIVRLLMPRSNVCTRFDVFKREWEGERMLPTNLHTTLHTRRKHAIWSQRKDARCTMAKFKKKNPFHFKMTYDYVAFGIPALVNVIYFLSMPRSDPPNL